MSTSARAVDEAEPVSPRSAHAWRRPAVHVSALRLGALVGALVVYAWFSDPTPDRPGLAELVIGALLVAAVGPVRGVATVLIGPMQRRSGLPHELPGWLLLAFGAYIALWLGVSGGWSTTDVARDVIGHVFFLMPVFLCAGLVAAGSERSVRVLTWTLAGVGVVFAARFLLISESSLGEIGRHIYVRDENLYLSADPTLLFGAIFLMSRSLWAHEDARGVQFIARLLAAGGAILIISVFLLRGVRGPSALAFVSFVVLMLYGLRRPRLATVAVILSLVGVVAVGLDQLQSVTELMLAKQESVGLNRRDLEFAVVLRLVESSPRTLLLGLGWGSLFRNPVTDWAMVSFAHWTVTFFLLKGGVVGVILMLAYAASFLAPLRRVFERDFGLALALTMPLAVGFMINGSFRFVTFGVLLAVVQLAGAQRVEEP